ncbi:hypothetical protein IV203_034524 [Nitzschia inconspicua]|uniref:Uncharacterized protein n=1 Tax=Nitzschia inconspicua TaxID=303405 RepID=A0A9K3PU37_9STRA|nr:hypothetical protein IV203_002580 [Nitzschia inconspicua]KAG7359426.1 hypothetical protein IV203_034524 [Nitzschia inconspicua]
MSLSYLVEEYHEDLLVEDTNVTTDNNNTNMRILREAEAEEEEEGLFSPYNDHGQGMNEPFDVIQATSSNEGSSIDVRDIKKNNSRNDNTPYTVATTKKPLINGTNPVTPSPPQKNMRGTPTNEIGELPALSRSKSDPDNADQQESMSRSNSSVTGARGSTRIRPLSPPSRAGLEDPEVYNQKLYRSSASTGSEDYNLYGSEEEDFENGLSRGSTSYGTASGKHSHFASMDEMPMDERRDFAKEQAERRLDALAVCTSGDDPASAFCDQTLTSMNDWCSGGTASSKNAAVVAAAKRSLALKEKHSIGYAGGVEEQTAIEVEYVEPMYRGKDGDDEMYSPKRKNALLRAMARRAKDEYQSKHGGKQKEARDTSPTTTDATHDCGGIQVGAPSTANENVYASFSPSEKRKFLKLINGGMTPFDATSQVMKERLEAEETKSAASSSDGSPVASRAAADSGAALATSVPKKNKKDKEPITPKRRGLAFWKRGKDKNADKDDEAAQTNAKSKGTARGLASAPSTTKSPLTPPQVTRRTYQDSGDDEIADGFARSGINYYDAVRRDRSIEDGYDDEEHEEETSRKSLPKSKGMSVKFPKIGFSKLGKSESNDDERAPRTPPQQVDRGAVQVEPHVAIPSPAATATSDSNEEDFVALAASPNIPQHDSQADDSLQHIPVQADTGAQDRGIPPSTSGDSFLTEPGAGIENHAKKADEEYQGDDSADVIEEAMTAKLLGVPASRSFEDHLLQRDSKDSQSREHIELDVDTYLHSTETMSQLGNAHSFDHVSVISGRSYRTSQTAGTNFTQSTRTRRPGQGKVRLEKEKKKQQQKKPCGWQESIQAVAARTGRVWDPEHGWKDYVDPTTSETGGEMGLPPSEMMHLPVDRFKRRAEDDDSLFDGPSEPGSPVRVPFPSDWDEERSGMLQIDDAGMDRSLASSRAPSSPGRRNKNPKVLTPSRDDRPRGWKETMMAATANINTTDGKRWDPERGWIGSDGEEIVMAADLEKERAYFEQVAFVADSDMQDFGTIKAEPAFPSNDAEHRKPSVEQLEAIADMNQDSGHQFLSEEEDPITDEDLASTARSMDTKSVGKYMQIKETGSVSSHYRNPAKKQMQLRSLGQEPIPEDHVADATRNTLTGASPATREMFARMDEAQGEGDATHVQREGLNQDDAGLFGPGQDANAPKRSGPVDLDDVYDEEMSAMQDVLAIKETEPPDDERHEQATNDSFGEAQDFSWDEEDVEEQGFSNQKPVPRLKINIRNPNDYVPRSAASGSEVSFGSLSTSSKSIPKLRGPKRDSSPIHGSRRPTTTTMHPTKPRRDPDIIVSTLSPRPLSQSPPSMNEKELSPHATEEFIPKTPVAGRVVTPEKEYIKEASPRNPVVQPDPPESMSTNRSVPIQPITRKLSEDSEPASVKSLHDYWEARSTTPPTAQSAEWKSFLAKKVQAETAAAAAKKARLQQDKDSIFDFHGSEGYFPSSAKKNPRRPGEPHEGAFDDISDLSPIRHDESDSDFVPSETSTQVVQGTTFLQRLQACAAPIVTKSAECGPGVPMAAHLAFLRSNPAMGGTPEKYSTTKATAPPATLCGRPDVIVEEDDEETEAETVDDAPSPAPVKSRSRSNPRSSRQKDDVSSVISDEFGAKTAYFEALAMKAAVSGGSKKKKRSPGSDVSGSTHSKTSVASSKHSDKFQQFLDRRASKSDTSSQAAPAPPPPPPPSFPPPMPKSKPPTGRQDVSSRAERYASEKVEEMIETMTASSSGGGPRNNKNNMNNNVAKDGRILDYRGRPMDQEETGAFPTLPRPIPPSNNRLYASSSRAAAEELAAARVEAMMASLSTDALEDDEGEI